jgi:acetyl esterase/lipase
MKTIFYTVSFLLFLGTGVFSQEVIRLYDGPAPGSEDWDYKEIEYRSPGNQKLMVRNVTDPTLEVYRPEASKMTGTAVIVCPGGAFVWLSYQNEGTEVAQWLANKGITAFVLKYRLNQTPEDPEEMKQFTRDFFNWLPKRDSVHDARFSLPPGKDHRSLGFRDGIRALEYVHEHAGKYGIDPDRIGILGFSAGAGVTMNVVLNSSPENGPDFAAPIYGGWKKGTRVPVNAPPLFILAAADDRLVTGSVDLYQSWIDAGRSAELHIYSKGGHGFGMDQRGIPVDSWIERFHNWLKATGF